MYIRKAICPIPVILYALLALASRDSSCFGELNYSDSAMLLLIFLRAMYHEELKQVEIMHGAAASGELLPERVGVSFKAIQIDTVCM